MHERSLETEVKFRVPDLAALRDRLIARGAILAQPRHLERNVLFDDDAKSLRGRGMLLRLRDALGAYITLKAPAPPERQSSQHKARVEHEISVDNVDTAFAILAGLGYTPWWRYEKYRESFRLGDPAGRGASSATVALDHTPIGDFVEIEAPPESIRLVAEQLGFDWSTRNLQTYRELFDATGRAAGADMTFGTVQTGAEAGE
jgi:adenylate cyclase class 2